LDLVEYIALETRLGFHFEVLFYLYIV